MTKRPQRLQIEEPVYTGEIITPVQKKQDRELELKKMEQDYALQSRKLEIASDVVEIGKKIVYIIGIRESSAAKVKEIDANIRQLEAMTAHEVAIRQQDRNKLETKGKIVKELLAELTPVLISHHLSTEDRKAAIELFDNAIEKVLKHESS
ncbi:hypothetical protein [Neobacillus vireti]|uniref:hypothetical protein n=1 Tax=Neobacillus vireti TaxID=220686 RepID=UPI002FFF8C03